MTLSSFQLYVLISLSKIGIAAWFVAVASALAFAFIVVPYVIESTTASYQSNYENTEASVQKIKFYCKISAITCACSTLLACIIPSKTETAAIEVLPAIVNSEAVQTIPAELTTLAIEWMKELHPKHK